MLFSILHDGLILELLREARRLRKRRFGLLKICGLITRQLVDGGTKPFEVRLYPVIIDILRKGVRHPFLRAIPFGEIKFAEWITPICGLVPRNHWIVSPDPYRLVVMRERESKNLPMDLLLASYGLEEFDHTSDRNSHAMSILTVGNVKSRRATFDFDSQERKVHVICGQEKGAARRIANERLQPDQLTLGESRARESNGIVRLRTRFGHGDTTVPAFIDTLDEDIEMLGAKRGKGFGRGDNYRQQILFDSGFVLAL